MARGFDPTKTNIPGTNLPYSVPNKGTLPEWDKNIPTALQKKGNLLPIFTGSNTGNTPVAYGGSMRWFDPVSGKTYNNNGLVADNQFTGYSNMGTGSALLQQRAAANGGVLTTKDYQDALRLMDGGKAPKLYSPTPVNYRNYNNPTEMNNSYVPQGDQQYEGGVHQFGDGNYYFTPDVKPGGGFASGGRQPIKIPSQFIDPRASIEGGQKLTAEGKKWLQEQKRFGPRATPPTSPTPLSTSSSPNLGTASSSLFAPSPTTSLPRTPTSPSSFGTPPSWAMFAPSTSAPNSTPNNTSAITSPLFPPPNTSVAPPPSAGNLFGGLNYGGTPNPVSNYNSPLFQGNNNWQEFIRQWLQGNNVQQNS